MHIQLYKMMMVILKVDNQYTVKGDALYVTRIKEDKVKVFALKMTKIKENTVNAAIASW